MKYFVKFLSSMLLLLCMLNLTACKEDSESDIKVSSGDIIGTWSTQLYDKDCGQYDWMLAFGSDGMFSDIIVYPDYKTVVSGTWELNKGQLFFHCREYSPNPYPTVIKFISKTKLDLYLVDDDETITFTRVSDSPNIEKESDPFIYVPKGETDYFGQTVTVPAEGDTLYLALQSNYKWKITISSNTQEPANWCTVSFVEGWAGGSTIESIYISKNKYTTKRSATISVNAGGLVKSFTIVQEESPYDPYNGHEYVDLGLPSGLKWATCNVGALAPEEYGEYYAWGEIEPKESYNEDNYKHYHLVTGTSEDWANLGDISCTEYDVARQKWGSPWRMPMKSEIIELVNNCTWSWTKKNDANGYKVTGPNGNWIFLPAAGYRNDTNLRNDGLNGFYWSSTPEQSYPSYAYRLFFDSSNINSGITGLYHYHYRFYGRSVRPVTE